MHFLVEDKHQDIDAICRRFDVRRLEVFGSAARGVDFQPDISDVDFLVEFDPASRLPPLDDSSACRRSCLLCWGGRSIWLRRVRSETPTCLQASSEIVRWCMQRDANRTTLKARQYVGVVQLGVEAIEVIPKIGWLNDLGRC